MSHAVLSPSASKRWLTCTPSARLEQEFPDATSSYAEEGTLAHSFAEVMLNNYKKAVPPTVGAKKIAELKKHELFQPEMIGYVRDFVDLVISHMKPGSYLFVETKLDMTNYVDDGFGTADAIVIANHVMDFFDLKYGKGVPVSAEENTQLMIYALGALNDYGHLFDIKQVNLHIFQPRLDSHTTWSVSVEELIRWAETTLRPAAALAYEGNGELVPGEHCKFCRAAPRCKALADFNLELAKKDFAAPQLLTDEELTAVLSQIDILQAWVKVVNEYALAQALSGKKWPGYKLVEGRSVRKYSDPILVEKALVEAGIPAAKIMEPPTLLGITKLEKEIGKAQFEEIVVPYLIKPPGSPTLVPATDKRNEWSSASNDFKD